ncbi:MAG: tyrosine--tRNA ligase [Candidatus Magasanikbacteria bacterium CG_4_10_14_0_2_um_filter_33_14]|uniref:Tyrosine--tRNA ligase n=1 Tax=Candidatus Magasanikbacteria bacterium CG_4_10_14_0_2_um_filter_33_14 TaxID=1974636 RepID=A0A2M7VC36_9BACT|nr:MAG: tyrosine--tRNA ligase [Candidatus Magasanikbacteria bacterium CG_4_10_14_0_2_um_filter_33_14]
MNVIIDEEKIQNLLSRGVENIYPKRDFLEAKLKSGERLTLYTGYDPTAPTLHIGHGITMLKLREFQQLGHRVIMLIGDYTGMIGDPTDKGAARTKLTREQVLENCKMYQEQASAVLDFEGENPVEVRYNGEWFSKMNFADVLDLTSHFTVQRMLERDMFDKRMKEEKPIYLHEFLYPVMQGYDSVAMDVDGEIGGNDQTFNMLAGRTLMKDLKNKEKFVLTGKLLTDSTGKKMGKSEGNMVAFSDTPEDMFGKIMNWTDTMIVSGFEVCTRIPMEEIESMKKDLDGGANPRDAKFKLAYEITKTFLGEESAKIGQAHFEKVIQSKDRPDEIAELKPTSYNIIEVLVESGLSTGKSDARRAIEQGGVKVNDEKIEAFDYDTKPEDVIQKGKRFFVKVK